MRTVTFIAITLLAGLISGVAHGIINLGTTEPFIEQAIQLEIQKVIAEGEPIGTPEEISYYRNWQRGGQILAGAILGISYSSLFSIVFAFARPSLLGSSNTKKALILAAVMWLAIFMIPFLKYPANPPAVGDPETIYYRQTIYLLYASISGLGALGFAYLYRYLRNRDYKKAVIPALYAAYVTTFYFLLPSNPDPITAPMDLVNNFRIASAGTVTIFWILLGFIFGSLWDKYKPHLKLQKLS